MCFNVTKYKENLTKAKKKVMSKSKYKSITISKP